MTQHKTIEAVSKFILGTIFTGGISAVVLVFTTFEFRSDANTAHARLNERVDRIEDRLEKKVDDLHGKIDRVIELIKVR